MGLRESLETKYSTLLVLLPVTIDDTGLMLHKPHCANSILHKEFVLRLVHRVCKIKDLSNKW